MTTTSAALVAALVAATALPLPASAQTRSCGARDRVVASLEERFGETRRTIGLGARNHVFETWASDETGTWTITATSTAGITCLVASGQSFETVEEILEPASADDA